MPPPSGPSFPPPADRPLPQAPAPAVDHCYRHPEREAGRHCSRCGRAACAQCLVQASVGSHCVECARAGRPSATTRLRWWSAGQHAPVTLALMAINIGVFVVMAVRDRGTLTGDVSTADQIRWGLHKYLLASDERWIRLLSAGFVHFGIIHLGFNMFSLYWLGNLFERAMPKLEYLGIYLASLLAGSAGVMLLGGNGLNAGASGAIFGLLGALAAGQLRRGGRLFGTQIGTLLMMNLMFTFFVPNISIGGHLGGLVGGALCGLVCFAPRQRPAPRWARLATPFAVAAVSVLISVLVANSTTIPTRIVPL